MRYSNRDSFVLASPSAMGRELCSLEAVMAGIAAGARGCVLPVSTSKDGITLVCATGSYRAAQTGETLTACDHDFASLRAAYPKIVSFGQALECVKAAGGGLGVELHHHQAAAQVRVSLKYSEYLDKAYFCGMSMEEAGRLAARYPDIQVMADLDETPEDPVAFVRSAQNLRLFGLRGAPGVLSEALCNEALRCGLFLASTDTSDPEALRCMKARGVNFIETSRPDLAATLMAPDPEPEPEPEPQEETFVPFSNTGSAEFIPYYEREENEDGDGTADDGGADRPEAPAAQDQPQADGKPDTAEAGGQA